MKKEPVQSLWIGGQLSKVEQLCIKSFIDLGHDFHLYAYETIENAPAGTKMFDARSILPEERIFRYKEGWAKDSVSGFADLFRLVLIQKNGGWWVDMDIICLKPLVFPQKTIFCSSYEGEYGALVNNCLFRLEKDHPFLAYCIDRISKIDLENLSFGEAGPFLFQQAVKELQLEKEVMPFFYFNPISWKYVGDLILGKTTAIERMKEVIRPIFKPHTMHARTIKPDTYTIHFWNEVWKTNHYDKNAHYPAFSMFERLKKRHHIK